MTSRPEDPPLAGSIDIPPFRIDVGAGLLWRGTKSISLRPKPWAVLLYLVQRRGLLVSREELQAAVWADAEVCDDNLTQSIAALRRMLEDDLHHPRFIETAHRRGYRFIGAVHEPMSASPSPLSDAPTIVCREPEIEALCALLRESERGKRQTAFVIGEPGIGKTSLVDAFLWQAAQQSEPPWIARGQSVEHYGEHEPFAPVIEALDRLLSSPLGNAALPTLQRYAPRWFSELAAARTPSDADRTGSALGRTTPPMLREIAVALDALTTDRTLVLVLEDLHWADPSTVDVISALAQRTERARLLVVATYRPAEAAVRGHPIARLRPTLQHRGRCVQVALEPLPPAAIATYLAVRFTDLSRAGEIAAWLHRRTEGNPLFVTSLVDYLTERSAPDGNDGPWSSALAGELDAEIPETLRGMVEAQLDMLDPGNRRVLEAASAVGVEFDAQCVAAALEMRVEDADAVLTGLAHTHALLQVASEREWPDGSVAGRYEFRHVVYRQTLYACLSPAVCRETHHRVARRLESGFGKRAPEIAAELAHHLEQAGDRSRALSHLVLGAERVLERGGIREASSLLDGAEQLLALLPASVDRDRTELAFMSLRAVVLSGMGGYAAEGIEAVLERCRHLATQLDDDARLFSTVRALWYLHGTRGDVEATWALVEELRQLSTRLDHRCTILADVALGISAVWAGELATAQQALERVESEMDAGRLAEFEGVGDYGVAPFLQALCNFQHALWLLGDPNRAREVRRATMIAAERLGHPVTLAWALWHATLGSWLCNDTEEAETLSLRGMELATEHGLGEFIDLFAVSRGAALVQGGRTDEGLAMLRQGFERYVATEARLVSPIFTVFVTSCFQAGQFAEGLAVVERIVAPNRPTIDHMFEAELWRLKGDLLRARAGALSAKPKRRRTDETSEAAEECFARALATSRRQGARALELRVLVSVARLRRERGDAAGARTLLEPIVTSFGEGLETPDLQVARRLLRELDGEEHRAGSPLRRASVAPAIGAALAGRKEKP